MKRITRSTRRQPVRLTTASLVLLLGALLGFGASSGCSRAQAVESFELDEHPP